MAAKTASVSGDWNNTATWGGAAKPTTSDTVTLNDGITLTINENTAAVQSFTVQAGGTGATIVFTTFNLSVAGSITLEANTTITAGTTGELKMTASGTLTTAGVAITTPFTMTGTGAVLTLGSDVTVAGLVTLGNATAHQITAGAGTTLVCQGGLTMSSKLILNSTVVLELTGGTITGSSTTGNTISGDGIIEFNGALTLASLSIADIDLLVTVNNLSGTGTIYMDGTATTITGALTVYNIQVKGTALTVTLTGALTVTNHLLSGASGSSITFAGGQAVSALSVRTTTTNFITVVRDPTGTFTCTGIANYQSGGVTIVGAQDLSVASFVLLGKSTFTFPAGQKLTVTTTLVSDNSADIDGVMGLNTIQSGTASTSFELAIDPACSVTVMESAFTDVVVTGRVIYNPYGGTLLRSSGIVNFATNASLQSIRSYGFQG